jgi:hypothetical protein
LGATNREGCIVFKELIDELSRPGRSLAAQRLIVSNIRHQD